MDHDRTKTPQIIWDQLANAVLEMDEGEVILLAEELVTLSYSARDAITYGLAEGMRRVGERFAEKIYFVPEVLVCAETMYAGFNILKEHVLTGETIHNGTAAIAVVEGDFHDIGKSIVKLMIEAAGIHVYDLGKNVSQSQIVTYIHENRPDILALSTLLTTTMETMSDTITAIRKEFGPDSPYIMIGGAPITERFAREIGADYYGEDAHGAVSGALKIINTQKH